MQQQRPGPRASPDYLPSFHPMLLLHVVAGWLQAGHVREENGGLGMPPTNHYPCPNAISNRDGQD